MARDRAARRDRRAAAGPRQTPWRRLSNPYEPVRILSDDQVEAIHGASLRLLEEIGLDVWSARALDALARAGADVDRTERRARLDRGLIEEHVARVPPRFELRARNPERTVGFGGRELVFATVGGPAFASDLARGRRAGTFQDTCDFARLTHMLNVIHLGDTAVEPTDLAPETRYLDVYRAFFELLDRPWTTWGMGSHQVEDALAMAGIVLGANTDELARTPVVMTVINSNSPLRLDGPMGDGLVAMAEAGQPVIATPFTLAGAMSPVTLAGALAQQNAEALAMIALAQSVRPGTPMVYGGFTSNVDMRTGAPAFGTPEYVKAAFATGQLARRYRVPWRSSNVNASNVVDAQAAYESEMAVWGAIMGGVNLLYQGAGWLEGGLTASFEKLILDAEILQMMAEVLQPFAVDDQSLGVDAVAEVGPGGHFFGAAHTIERFGTAFYSPLLSDWRNFETWTEDGARNTTERAHGIWHALLEAYEPPPIDAAILAELDAFVARRKAAIAAA
ncbi:MAG: trimethylamine methyltransferase family protein [Alphaproteobacteria bacterium]|nr:trimethylamine methyltransferase family protein [Alphaproteobacteria bacterium]